MVVAHRMGVVLALLDLDVEVGRHVDEFQALIADLLLDFVESVEVLIILFILFLY